MVSVEVGNEAMGCKSLWEEPGEEVDRRETIHECKSRIHEFGDVPKFVYSCLLFAYGSLSLVAQP